jgi:hypothetical protein
MKTLIYFATLITAITVFIFSCKKDDDIYSQGNPGGTSVSTLIKIVKVSKTILDADSASVSIIEVNIHPETDSASRIMIFTTTLGSFLNGKTSDTARADAYGHAFVSLLSNSTGTANIRARVKFVTVDTTVTFTQALPDDMLMTADKYIGDTNAVFTITNNLFRNSGRGKVTDPVKVFYSVTPELLTSPPLIYPQFAFSTGRRASIIILNPAKGKGNYRVDSKVVSALAPTDTIRRNVTITIQ